MKHFKKILVLAGCILLSFQGVNVSAADYTVMPNDSLFKISQLFGVPIDTLKRDNYLTSDTILSGQILYVPSLIYTVKSGDTLYLISKNYQISLTALRQANHKYDDRLIPGQKLIIPGIKPETGTGTVIPYYGNEVDLLARLIEAETSGESYKAKAAVGAVVINRVQSNEWAPTITDVIYQKYGDYYQFTPVKNNMINNPASSDSLRAAWAALYGSDPSNGAVFYFDNSSTNQWLWSKTQTANIDHMVFVK